MISHIRTNILGNIIRTLHSGIAAGVITPAGPGAASASLARRQARQLFDAGKYREGETVSARYSDPELAVRSLEQTVSAVLLATALPNPMPHHAVNRLIQRSCCVHFSSIAPEA